MDALVTVTYKEINWHNLWNRLEIIGIGKKHEKTVGMGRRVNTLQSLMGIVNVYHPLWAIVEYRNH